MPSWLSTGDRDATSRTFHPFSSRSPRPAERGSQSRRRRSATLRLADGSGDRRGPRRLPAEPGHPDPARPGNARRRHRPARRRRHRRLLRHPAASGPSFPTAVSSGSSPWTSDDAHERRERQRRIASRPLYQALAAESGPSGGPVGHQLDRKDSRLTKKEFLASVIVRTARWLSARSVRMRLLTDAVVEELFVTDQMELPAARPRFTPDELIGRLDEYNDASERYFADYKDPAYPPREAVYRHGQLRPPALRYRRARALAPLEPWRGPRGTRGGHVLAGPLHQSIRLSDDCH